MSEFIVKEVVSEYIEKELENIGFDAVYREKASDKFRYKNLKIYNLTPAQANIIKQTALACGTDCAVHKEVITGKTELSDAILSGSFSHLRKVADKLINQPFGLKDLAKTILCNLDSAKNKIKLVGILNITPDSSSDGGEYFEVKNAIKKLHELIDDGADMIDIGAESTRPGSLPVDSKEQIERLKPILLYIQSEDLKIPVSVDTRSSEVADFALNNGVAVINDVSGFDFDKNMPSVIAKYNAGVIIQHSKGTPDVMQNSPNYENLIDDIYMTLKSKSDYAKGLGINNIIIDPGIGFGKTKEDNFEIIKRIEEFYSLKLPLMLGVSRKSFLSKEKDNQLRDTLSCVVGYELFRKGIDYLRVHNVKQHKSFLELF